MTQVGGRELGLAEYALVAGIGAFVLLRIPFLFPRFSDGNAYLYMAKLVAEGAVPYRDFFFASPPLLLYLFVLGGLIFGFSWQVFSFFPLLLSTIDAVLIFLVARRLFSPLGGLVAALLYLFSFVTLATSDFYSGVHGAVTLVLCALFLQQRRWSASWQVAGLLYAAAALVKIYTGVFLVAAVVTLASERKWREARGLLLGSAILLGVVAVAFWFLAGDAFVADVILNHLVKTAGIPKGRIGLFFVKHDVVLVAGMLLPLLFRWPPRWVVLPALLATGYFLLFRDVYYLHLKMLVPYLALLWGWGIWRLEQRRPKFALAAAAVLLVLSCGAASTRYVREQARAGVISHFEDMVTAVERAVPSGGVLYGDYSVTPLLALAADRAVYNNYVDVNPAYFLTGLFNYDERAEELKEANVQTIVTKAQVTPTGQVVGGPETVLPAQFFADYCQPQHVFKLERDYEHNAVVLWRCAY